MCCSSTQRRRAFAGRHFFVLASSSGLRGHKRIYLTILESTDHALLKMVRYVLLRPLRPELDAKTKTSLPAKTRFCHLDEQAISTVAQLVLYLPPSKQPAGRAYRPPIFLQTDPKLTRKSLGVISI
jgi:hypothetical protein